jgi:hypothetical protein
MATKVPRSKLARRLFRIGAGRSRTRNDTEYLLSSPRNAAALREAMEQADRGEGLLLSAEELRRSFPIGTGR